MTYLGEFALDEDTPFFRMDAAEPETGAPRQVIVFRLHSELHLSLLGAWLLVAPLRGLNRGSLVAGWIAGSGERFRIQSPPPFGSRSQRCSPAAESAALVTTIADAIHGAGQSVSALPVDDAAEAVGRGEAPSTAAAHAGRL